MKVRNPTAPPTRAPIVLVVDDDLTIRTALSKVLTASGYEVRTTDRGEKALALCGVEPPDLAIIDVMMPGMDGWRVSKHLVRSTSGALPIVLISGTLSEVELHPNGVVVALLPKPIDFSLLLGVIEGAVAQPLGRLG